MYRGFSCVDDFPRAICLPVDAPTRCSAPRGEIELGEAAYDGVILAVTPDGTCEKGADALRAFGCTEQGFRDRKSVVSAI